MRSRLELLRGLLYWRRVAPARAWRDAERAQADEHHAAVRRLLDRAAALPAKPPGQR